MRDETLRKRLKEIMEDWQTKAKVITEKFEPISAAQTQVVMATIEACVDDLQTILKETE